MKYETNNLDEAAYLALQGYDFTVTRTGQISALFSFEKVEGINEVRSKFWKGEVSVLLHNWLATRAALKKNACVRCYRASLFHRRRSYLTSARRKLPCPQASLTGIVMGIR